MKRYTIKVEKPEFDHFTIEPRDDGTVSVYGHGTYESGVLKGTPRRAFREHFNTVEEARAAFPGAEETRHSTRDPMLGGGSLADMSGLPKCPPSDFDPDYAGERWDDDY